MKSNLGGWFIKYVSVDKIFDFEFHCIDAMSEDPFFYSFLHIQRCDNRME